MEAVFKSLLTGEEVRVHSTTDHPCSSYGQAVWVDGDNNCVGVVGLPLSGYLVVK